VKARGKLGLNMSAMDIAVEMSEGNPGACAVIGMILGKGPSSWFTLLDLDDMNIRGPQIWVGYKDHCKENIDDFIAAVKRRDAQMIATINKECPEWKAVKAGASF